MTRIRVSNITHQTPIKSSTLATSNFSLTMLSYLQWKKYKSHLILCARGRRIITHINRLINQLIREEKQKKRSKYQRDIDDDHSLSPEEDIMHLRKCPRLDYDLLNKPIFPDETGDDILPPGETTNAAYDASFGGDEPKTLQEAKEIPDWPQWEIAIKSELNQLTEMGTWELIERPKEVIPIANKWVFWKKYNQIGEMTKYKARLVVHLLYDWKKSEPY